MKIYVISLKHSPRRKFIKKQFAKLNLDFEFIDAIDGRTLSEEEIKKQCDYEEVKKYPTWLNAGAIGCALSHKKSYEKIIENNLPAALILEDDVLLPYNLSEILRAVEKVILTAPLEVILFYYRSFKEAFFSSKNKINLVKNYSILFPLAEDDIPVMAGAYVINKRTCQKLFTNLTPIRVTADSWKYFFNKGFINNISIIYPRPIKNANLKSEINYLETLHGKFTARVFYIVNKIPIIKEYLVFRREKREKLYSKFTIVDKPSFLFKSD